MNKAENDLQQSTNTSFNELNADQRWKLRAESRIADAVYNEELPQKQANELDQNHKNSEKIVISKKENISNAHKEFIDLQASTKEISEKFSRQEDFLRHLELGSEFEEASQYNSRRKVSDLFGFEYCIPPKERTIQAKVMGTYNTWIEKDKLLKEEEEYSLREINGSNDPFVIDDLIYDLPYEESETYENYYYKIKELRHAEQKYQNQVLNVADSAMILEGNVAFGKITGNDNDENHEFERKVSTNSLGDIGDNLQYGQSNTKKRLTNLAKRMRKRKSSSADSEIVDATKSYSTMMTPEPKSSNKNNQFVSLRRKIKQGRETLRLRNKTIIS